VAGQKFLVLANGPLVHGHSDPETDSLIQSRALACLRERQSQLVALEANARIYFDLLCDLPRLVICGSGRIAVPLATLAFANRS
jgi:hypothetical protein